MAMATHAAGIANEHPRIFKYFLLLNTLKIVLHVYTNNEEKLNIMELK